MPHSQSGHLHQSGPTCRPLGEATAHEPLFRNVLPTYAEKHGVEFVPNLGRSVGGRAIVYIRRYPCAGRPACSCGDTKRVRKLDPNISRGSHAEN